ncbi:MAG: trehalose 6-phosphate synthase/phosphatase [Clostridia bacterium]|nr:trehalose 6-phosphate synthase/phosphatase [Clostridia bacterium]
MVDIKPIAKKSSSNLVVISNRGACTFKETPQGIKAIPSISGLVSALLPVLDIEGGSWIAWGGRYGKESEVIGNSLAISSNDSKFIFHEVMLTREEVELYYNGFSNSCLWPLCHNFIEKAVFKEEYWKAYCEVNKKYSSVFLKTAGLEDWVWVHDYHLALLPGYIRKSRPHARVALFWHIPFPPPEIFNVIPWSKEIIRGMLESQLIGFHSPKYVQNFIQTAKEIAGAEVDFINGYIYCSGRKIKVITAPIGIDWHEIRDLAKNNQIIQKAAEIRKAAGGEYLLLGVDRLDYTKGIIERLKAVSWLLKNHSQYRSKLTFIQIAAPSRENNSAYQKLRHQVEETIGYLNGIFTENYHVPIRYIFKSLDKSELVAHYLAADMALVTPLKDGMNLVAKEYVAANDKDIGVLLLSSFAGAASQLKGALISNPYNTRETSAQIIKGLKMSLIEKKQRLAAMNRVVKEQDIYWWWQKFQQSWREASRGKCLMETL